MGVRPLLLVSPAEAALLRRGAAEAGLELPLDGPALAQALAERRLDLSPEQAAQLAWGLMLVDLAQMQAAGPHRPRVRDLIRQGRLRYEVRDPDEHWQTYRELVAQLVTRGRAGADCEDLASAWAAEARADGWDAAAHPLIYRVHRRLSHVVVALPGYAWRVGAGYAVVDPSRLAGMGLELA